MEHLPFSFSTWIWVAAGECDDQYAEFRDTLPYSGTSSVLLRLSCDSDYALFLNERYVASNQYGDYEHYKIYDTLDLSAFLKPGDNDLRILIYHCGAATSRYRPAKAGLIYEILSDGEPVRYSRAETLSRISPAYVSGKKVPVSPQLGFTFTYDAGKESDTGYYPSVPVSKNCTFYPRPIKKAVLKKRQPMKSLTSFSDSHDPCRYRYLIDLGKETVGLPTLDVVSKTEQTLTVAWGEHLTDGGVLKTVGSRHFYYRFKTRKGRNRFTEFLLRIGCRYLEVFAESEISLNYVGVIPQVYEVETRRCIIAGETDRQIYNICVNTLKLCMMEHYVDCPWREQALYAFDSRNQMLFGYYAFRDGNAPYARANLKLIGEDRRPDGLLSICFPSGTPLAIPSFSLYYILAVKEYILHTGDTGLSSELLKKLYTICEAFLANEQDGLIQTFAGKEQWNFYDWSLYSSGSIGKDETPAADLALNCLFVLALDSLQTICTAAGEPFPDRYSPLANRLRARIREEFLTGTGEEPCGTAPNGVPQNAIPGNAVPGAYLFTMQKGKQEFTVLGNSLAVLAGVVTGADAGAICDAIVSGRLTDCSLSMKILEYDALLNTNTERYRDFVLAEIRKNYQPMLDAGSDTVWETAEGASAFHNAGSLCHGWSAVPVAVFHRLRIATYYGGSM